MDFRPRQPLVLRETLLPFSNRSYTVLVAGKGEERRGWFVLVYKLPVEPTRMRASVWRKLKAAGAVYLQNGVAALPADAAGERAMRGAAQEVREFGGTAHLLRGEAVGDEAALVGALGEARDAEYAEVLSKCRDFHAELEKERAAGKFTFAELEENEEDLDKLGAWLRKVELRDRFGAPSAPEARAAVLACREDLQAFAASVYEAADHGSAGSPPSGARERVARVVGPDSGAALAVALVAAAVLAIGWCGRHGG
jgi:hypothetical protein